ncbi:MAG: PDDEXK nuclease domain-containing protein, partial [Pelodictyon phaeoclathratiforme]
MDVIQVRTCWEIGRHIVEFEQGGQARAAYGKKLLSRLAESLTGEFGKGFDVSNLRYMRLFYKSFPICDTLCHELSWSHYRTMLRVDNPEARQWYMHEAAALNWSVRALDRQIGTLYYERLLLSSDKASVEAEAEANIAALPRSPREFVRDPVMLEFLGLPGTGKLLESKLEQALMDKLQAFLLELGKGFAFVARQQRISTESQDFYIDLV